MLTLEQKTNKNEKRKQGVSKQNGYSQLFDIAIASQTLKQKLEFKHIKVCIYYN